MLSDFTQKERALIKKLNTPQKVQDFLDTLPVNFEKNGQTCHAPRATLRNKKAHCMEGALLAAFIFMNHKRTPLLLHLKASKNDYDHVVALFKENGLWGAVSKTNHATLRYRDPVYKSVRELAMSYFHEYFPENGKKSLTAYSAPLNITRFNKTNWHISDDDAWKIDWALDEIKHFAVAPPRVLKNTRRAGALERAAGNLTEWKKN
jgi:hypothetical protein